MSHRLEAIGTIQTYLEAVIGHHLRSELLVIGKNFLDCGWMFRISTDHGQFGMQYSGTDPECHPLTIFRSQLISPNK